MTKCLNVNQFIILRLFSSCVYYGYCPPAPTRKLTGHLLVTTAQWNLQMFGINFREILNGLTLCDPQRGPVDWTQLRLRFSMCKNKAGNVCESVSY